MIPYSFFLSIWIGISWDCAIWIFDEGWNPWSAEALKLSASWVEDGQDFRRWASVALVSLDIEGP